MKIFCHSVNFKNFWTKQSAKISLSFVKCQWQRLSPKGRLFVPLQDFSRSWTDEELYLKYGLSDSEIEFIESMIKLMD